VILYVLYGMDHTAKVLGGCWIAAGIVYQVMKAMIAPSSRAPDGP
jgi:hypothetical protein